MTTVYYLTSYGEYKKVTHLIHGVDVVGHSMDIPMTDASELILKANAPDHIHLHFEKLGFTSLPTSHEKVVALATHHPLMRAR